MKNRPNFQIKNKSDRFSFRFPFYRVNWEEKEAKLNFSDFCKVPTNSIKAHLSEIHATEKSKSIIQNRETFLVFYTCIIALCIVCYLSRSFLFFRMCLQASINLHGMIFRGVTRAKMIFFNQNPSGRVLNRFARDINNVDSSLPIIMLDVLDVS